MYLALINGMESGPFTAEQLKTMANQGQIAKDDMIRKETGKKWYRANTVKGLFPTPEVQVVKTEAPQVIEATDKRWKLLQIIGVILIFSTLGLLGLLPNWLIIFIVTVGLISYTIGRSLAWWFQGRTV